MYSVVPTRLLSETERLADESASISPFSALRLSVKYAIKILSLVEANRDKDAIRVKIRIADLFIIIPLS